MGRRGRWEKRISEREEKWEDALALIMHQDTIATLIKDCGELYLRFKQMSHRFPEKVSLIEPGMERAEDMRDQLLHIREELDRARELLLEWREENGK